jgi:hypothetical protein
MATLFLCYRREDADAAGRLVGALQPLLPGIDIFMDVDSLPGGVDFVSRLDSALAVADVVLVVISRSWLTLADASGRRRLDDPDDFVRREVSTALERNVPTIPVLVQGAVMPTAEQLPDPMKPLARRQFVELRHARYRADVDKLARDIRALLPAARRWPLLRPGYALAAAAVMATLLGMGSAAYLWTLPRFSTIDLSGHTNDVIDWLNTVPIGTRSFEGVPFTILDGPRAAVKTSATHHMNWPQEVDIPIDAPIGVRRIHLMLSASWTPLEKGRLGAVHVTYDWGDDTVVDLLDGITVQETWRYERDLLAARKPPHPAGVAWRTVQEQRQQRALPGGVDTPAEARAFLDVLSIDTDRWRCIDSVRLVDQSDPAGLVLVAMTLER